MALPGINLTMKNDSDTTIKMMITAINNRRMT